VINFEDKRLLMGKWLHQLTCKTKGKGGVVALLFL